jgi:sec-independent protein translocase protein TatB
MSGIGGSEFLLLCLIGLLILGPERLPRVARQIGGWVGKARQMTRTLQRQLEEELDVEKNIGINPKDLTPDALLSPRDDDTYSPRHEEPAAEAASGADDVTIEKKTNDA